MHRRLVSEGFDPEILFFWDQKRRSWILHYVGGLYRSRPTKVEESQLTFGLWPELSELQRIDNCK